MRTPAILVAALAVTAVIVIRVVDGGGSSEERPVAAVDDTSPDRPTTAPVYAELPPDDEEAVAAMFGPALEDLGLRLTRAGLADSPGSGQDPSLRDRHFALYVEPLDADYAGAEYVDSLITSARVFLPRVFDEWPDLASMDICQEPPPGTDDRTAPVPYTVLEMSRDEAAQIDWSTVDVAGLLAARDDGLVRLHVNEAVADTPEFREVEAAA